jgi:hypothetical protein
VIANIYNKNTKGPTLIELFTGTGKLKKGFLRLEKFDVCTTGVTAHIDKLFKFFPHTCKKGTSIFFTAVMSLGTHVDACVTRT